MASSAPESPELFDVAIVSDFRYPGGTSASIAEEIQAQSNAGLSTALVHVPASHLQSVQSFNPRIRACIDQGSAVLALPGQPVRARLLVLRQPRVFSTDPDPVPMIEADHVVMVVNQPPRDGGRSRQYYDPAEVRARVERLFGPSEWAPIGPLVRAALQREDSTLELTDRDWSNVIDVVQWTVDRSSFPRGPVVIGRFSRPDRRKWPVKTNEILAAYPDTDDIMVRILGGGEMAVERLGYEPANWELHPFGSVDPKDFVAGIDVFVYFHAPDLVEAFGRTILEAMASGAPAILPATFRELFGDGAIYTDPSGVQEIVRSLHADPAAYLRESAKARKYVEENFSHATHVARVADRIGGGDSTSVRPGSASGDPSSSDDRDAGVRGGAPRPAPHRVMMLSSNGAGLGHVTRLMSLARRLPDDIEAIFATQSQAAPLVQRTGFLTEYIPSRGYLQVPADRWNHFLHQRMLHLIELHRPLVIVSDGTVPYGGLIRTIREHPEITWVWLRRAMWKLGGGKEWIRRGKDFDLILEPGDYSEDADRGATVNERESAHRVGPMTFLSAPELSSPDEARQALGLSAGTTTALLAFGAGNINDIQSPAGHMADRLLSAGVQVVLAQSPIASRAIDAPSGAKVVIEYPLSRYLRAFDFTISAAGYNSFHEAISFGVPSIFVPNDDTALDDQVNRVRHATELGAVLSIEDPTSSTADATIDRILDPRVRDSVRDVCERIHRPNGAEDAAQWLAEVVYTAARKGA